ncbi:MAG: pyruvate formate lyase-activating protein [Oscillospiraceae bacterium]|nr:pyruvate formate lyase-activating protein [Oscillospiraceae bacterium]
MTEGYIHSTESFGTVDGPGVRFVVFLQGCPMRCKYCHNPDTWEFLKTRPVSADEIIAEYEKNRAFYSNGGITVSGGEPMCQLSFVTELFSKAKKLGIHTCLDTSGAGFSYENEKSFRELIRHTDLVLLDIKHIDEDFHIELCGKSNKGTLEFAHFLDESDVPVWIRHVVVPGITDDRESLLALGRFIGKLKNVRALDVLPYHTLGVSKYHELGIPYPLDGVPLLSESDAAKARNFILQGIKETRA